jgi:hypothetical protein
MEKWERVDGWPLYDVSSMGRVRSWNSGRGGRRASPRIMRSRWDGKGYARVFLCQSGAKRERFIHQLVMEHHRKPRPTPSHEGRHLNGVRSDNRIENLEWSTHAVNMRDQYAHGTRARGDTHGMVKLSVSDVHAIRASRGRLAEAAERYGVSRSTICNIRLGQSWAHVPFMGHEATSPQQRETSASG